MSLERVTSGEPPRFLLLLPPTPSPPNTAALKSAYGETISEVLKEVATHSSDTDKAAVLEIALACPHLIDAQDKPRSSLYDETQALVAGLYRLVTSTAARENINVEDHDGVDVRVILVAWSSEKTARSPQQKPYGPIIDIETLARSGRQWQFAFGVESEAGAGLVKAFVTAKGSAEESVGRVQSGPVMNTSGSASSEQPSATAPSNPTHGKHFDTCVGGTWDHLHNGHKLLITMTIFAVDERPESEERSASVCVSGDQLHTKKKHAELLESWTERQKAVATFFNAIVDFSNPATSGQRHVSIRDDPGPNGKGIDVHYPNGLVVKCTEFQDAFGPTITDERISALVVSTETRAGGKAVNDKRKQLGWKEVDLFEVDVLDADEEGPSKDGFDGKISSTAIREKLARKAGGKM
ncbi:hypothetical protein M409DRAFT_17332 [Zasmidium cellare ATCC 36951]|uniref:Cytidyltransferase-like domain-containing protein n=1 Tax=Zasmidium cellare ATCC 36951 TaxID=1080233 RepID=A0A6A6D0X0_ZASCE|nr:uncharacterized protein M409DRAFT_17332 [Zasmidium cellare ATCC 36951]KAF2172090.1 hypothetical protein M409DRAFT_17332 [Zasmidium cellare ATCC 36951]